MFNPQGQILEIACIRNTGYGENSYPPAFSLVAVRGVDGLVAIDTGSITGLKALPENCDDRVYFTFDDMDQIATLKLELFSLQLLGSSHTFDVNLNSAQPAGIMSLQITALNKNRDDLNDHVFNSMDAALELLPDEFVYAPDGKLQYSEFTYDLNVTPSGDRVFKLTLFGTEASGEPFDDHMTVTVCGSGNYASNERCESGDGLRMCTHDFYLRTVADLAELESCDVVKGDVIVSSISGRAFLSSLKSLSNVGGVLSITDNAELASLTGLDKLTYVGGSVYISNNPALENVDALSRLAAIGDGLSINRHDALEDLDGLAGLRKLGGDLDVFDNAALISLAGLHGISRINGNLSVSNNGMISSLAGLQSIETIYDSFAVSGNAQLLDFGPALAIRTVGRKIAINQNPLLLDIDGLRNLVAVGGIELIGNYSLQSLHGFNPLRAVQDDIIVSANHALATLAGLDNLTNANAVEVTSNMHLVSLEGLDNLRSVNSLRIDNNPLLVSLAGLGKLQQLGALTVWRSARLTTLAGMDQLTALGSFDLEDSSSLNNLNGLPHITTLLDLRIAGMSGLADLSGLEVLQEVHGDAAIYANGNLMNMDALANLRRVDGDLAIERNDNLRSLAGINNLESLGASLILDTNESLAIPASLRHIGSLKGDLILRYTALKNDLPALEEVHGKVDISDALPQASINLGSLERIGGNLVFNSTRLANFRGLEKLSYVGGWVGLADNQELTSLTGLEHLQYAGHLEIGGSPLLQNLSGLGSLRVINGDLRIVALNVKDLRGMEQITNLPGNLSIESNPELLSLNGLQNLTNVGGEVFIHSNWRLQELDALDSLTSASAITIVNNPALPVAESQQLIRRLGL